MNSEILHRFFKGEATPEEVHRILVWINSQEGKSELEAFFDEFEDDIEISQEVSKRLQDSILHKINPGTPEIAEPIAPEPVAIPSRGRPRRSRIFYGFAACITVFVMAFAWWSYQPSTEPEVNETVADAEIWVEKSVGKGQKLKLKLSDGTEVYLNSQSKLRFPSAFLGSTREVFLEGEAFFNVEHNKEKPFIVHSKNVQTKVLGTSFTVREGTRSNSTLVAVLTGKVHVSIPDSIATSEENTVILEPMDAAKIDFSKNSLRRIRIEYDEIFAWKDNVIAFKNAGFNEVVDKLERWYGVTINLRTPLKSQPDYTGKFENQTLEEVLLGLSFIYDFDYEIRGSTVTIN